MLQMVFLRVDRSLEFKHDRNCGGSDLSQQEGMFEAHPSNKHTGGEF